MSDESYIEDLMRRLRSTQKDRDASSLAWISHHVSSAAQADHLLKHLAKGPHGVSDLNPPYFANMPTDVSGGSVNGPVTGAVRPIGYSELDINSAKSAVSGGPAIGAFVQVPLTTLHGDLKSFDLNSARALHGSLKSLDSKSFLVGNRMQTASIVRPLGKVPEKVNPAPIDPTSASGIQSIGAGEPKIVMPPGYRMTRIADIVFFFSPKTFRRISEEIIADYAHEMLMVEAMGKSAAELRGLRLRHWGGFVIALVLEMANGVVGRLWKALRGG